MFLDTAWCIVLFSFYYNVEQLSLHEALPQKYSITSVVNEGNLNSFF